jgi:predicted HTH domain antitoxin
MQQDDVCITLGASVEKYGRHEETLTPDLYRVKIPLSSNSTTYRLSGTAKIIDSPSSSGQQAELVRNDVDACLLLRRLCSWQAGRCSRWVGPKDKAAVPPYLLTSDHADYRPTSRQPDTTPNPGREVLEALAIEGYRVGTLSHYQASQLLGLSRFEFDGFLKGRHIYDHAYDLEDLEEDHETLRQLQAKGKLLRR